MKLVIGLVGEKGAGKQTFVNFLKEILKQSLPPTRYGVQDDKIKIATVRSVHMNVPRNDVVVRQVRFSDILAQTLILWDLPITRSNLQKLALLMNEVFGQTALANAAKFSLDGNPSDMVVFDGIRRQAELKLVTSFKNNLLIYITADQKIRYQRLKKRSEKVGETGLTFEQFLAEEKSKAESEIPNLGKKANLKIENNGTLEEFRKKVEGFYQRYFITASPKPRTFSAVM